MTALSNKLSNVFYGWWVVGACLLLSLYISGAVVLGFTAFFEPIADEFGWSHTQVSLAASLRGAEVGLLAPILGFLVDRWGPRRIVLSGVIIVGLGLIFLSRMTSLGMFYGAFVIVAIGDSGLSPTVLVTSVSNWFRKKLGLATGIMACGFALGGLLVGVVIVLIDTYGWRTAIFSLGIGMWVIGIPLSLLIRHKPEKYGYLPDGEKSEDLIPSELPSFGKGDDFEMGVKDAIKSRAFWSIGIAMSLTLLSISAIIVHIMPYLSSVGIERSTSAVVASTLPLISIIGRLGSGWLGDRFNKIQVAAGFFTLMGLGLLFLSYASEELVWLVIPFIILYGIGWGSNNPMRAALVGQYFGRRNFGTIFGLMMGMVAISAIVGPLFSGWVFDTWGSYHIAWLSFACLALASSIIIATMPAVSTNIQSNDRT